MCSRCVAFCGRAGEVIQGWDRAVATMKKGEKAILTIKPKYGYGKEGAESHGIAASHCPKVSRLVLECVGSPPEIPSNATLIFEVELVSFETPTKAVNPDFERLQALRKAREEGQ